MRKTWYAVFVVSQLVLVSTLGIAQRDSIKSFQDSSISNSIKVSDTIVSYSQKQIQGIFQPKKSPLLAMGLSVVVPGIGQIYDANYWKAPIIWGVGGYWIYQWVDLNNKYKDFRQRFLNTQSGQDLRLRDFYRDERDKYAWFLGVLYILNIVDAYAGAHLYDFDVSPELSASGKLVPRVTASIHFKF